MKNSLFISTSVKGGTEEGGHGESGKARAAGEASVNFPLIMVSNIVREKTREKGVSIKTLRIWRSGWYQIRRPAGHRAIALVAKGMG